MPEYKNIWYSDNSEPLSVAENSEQQAVSVGDALEKVKLNTSIICTDQAQVDEVYPNPVQGDRVYRADLGVEQMYFEGYNSVLNKYGKRIAGWYAIDSGLVPIVPALASGDGTSTSTNGLGKVTFAGAKNVALNEVFSAEFKYYKIMVNVTNTSAAGTIALQYITDTGTVISSSNYFRTVFASETATVAPPPSAQGTDGSIIFQASSLFRNVTAEITVFDPYVNNYVRTLASVSAGSFSTNNRLAQHATILNSFAGTTLVGVKLLTNQTATMDGTIQVYGYK